MAKDTKDIILDTAEKLFAKQGFNNTSLRNITTEADVNLASVNYHFGSKDALIQKLFERRIIPMNEQRISKLEQLEQKYGDHIALENLIDAFMEPAMELSRDTQKGGALFIKLLGRTYTDPSSELHDAIRQLYAPAIERFRDAFARVLPELTPDELYWRMHFMVGLLAYLMAGTDMMRLIASCKLCDPLDTDALIARARMFLVAGMQAPVIEQPDNTDQNESTTRRVDSVAG